MSCDRKGMCGQHQGQTLFGISVGRFCTWFSKTCLPVRTARYTISGSMQANSELYLCKVCIWMEFVYELGYNLTLNLLEAIPLYDIIQSYTNIYVNTQLFSFLMQLYFVLGDMFRLIIQPFSGQLAIERYLTILRPIWDPTLFTPNEHKINYL